MYREQGVELISAEMELWLMVLMMMIFGLVVLRFCGVLTTVAVVTLILLSFFYQNSILYANDIPNSSRSPSGNSVGYRHPSERGLPTHDVAIVTNDNVTLRGWLLHKKMNKRIVIYFHQNAGNLGYRISFIQYLFLKTDSDVLLVAYRGYSDSKGEPSERGLQLDSLAIVKYAVDYQTESIQNGYNKDIYVYGCSLGGAVAIYATSESPLKQKIKELMIQNTFTSFPDLIKAIFPYFTLLSLLSRNDWPSKDRIKTIQTPMLFIRSLKDKLIPPIQMIELFRYAKKSILRQDYRIPEGDHNAAWLINPSNFFVRLSDFFSKIEDI